MFLVCLKVILAKLVNHTHNYGSFDLLGPSGEFGGRTWNPEVLTKVNTVLTKSTRVNAPPPPPPPPPPLSLSLSPPPNSPVPYKANPKHGKLGTPV